MYSVTVKNTFEALGVEEGGKWNKALVTSAGEVIPKREISSKHTWMKDKILNLMKKDNLSLTEKAKNTKMQTET